MLVAAPILPQSGRRRCRRRRCRCHCSRHRHRYRPCHRHHPFKLML